jgi:DNA-binding CsgD family transcriptional regulator
MPTQLFLRKTYGLTAAEAHLALRLLVGQSLRNVARVLGITYETARNRLKSIFRKTGTHRQGELVALLTRATMRFEFEADSHRASFIKKDT